MTKFDIIQWDKPNWKRALDFLEKNKNKDVLELANRDGSLTFGQCLFIDNMSGAIFHQILRNKYGSGKDVWQYLSLGDFKEISKIFNQTLFNTFGILGNTHKKLRNFRNYFDAKYNKIFPCSWHYIYARIYQK